MPDTPLSLVRSPAPEQRTGRVTLLERKTALETTRPVRGRREARAAPRAVDGASRDRVEAGFAT